MERLTLTGRPKTGDKLKCLPAGDGLPIWSTLPLDAKLPMMDNPKGSVVLYTTKLGEPKHRSKQEYDFDLRDPNGQYIRGEYQPLHDPHLKSYFSTRMMKRHLVRKGFISDDGKVLCSLREFNYYRQYLRHLCFLEIAKERQLERKTSQKHTAHIRSDTNLGIRQSKGALIRDRIQERRERAVSSLNKQIREKSARLHKRLDEIRGQMMERLEKQKNEMKNKMIEIAKHQQEAATRGPNLLKKYQFRDEMRKRLMNERELQRRLRAEKELEEKWALRQQVQKEKLEETFELLKKDEEEKHRNIERRVQLAQNRRRLLYSAVDDPMNCCPRPKAEGDSSSGLPQLRGVIVMTVTQEGKVEMFKTQTREEKKRREERYRRRLEAKLAKGEFRTRQLRKLRRRPHPSQFTSTWKLDDVLQRLTATSLLPPTDRQPSFMVMFSAAIDDAVDIVTRPIDEALPSTDDDEETKLSEQAHEIVQGVISKVKNEIYPAYLKMLEEEETNLQPLDANISRSVRFDVSKEEIPVVSVDDENGDAYQPYRPTAEHVVTPVPSQLEIQKMEAEALLGSPELADKTSSVSFVETLLLRLLDDLNSNRLTNDEIMKLASYSMEVLQNREAEAQKDRTILETEEESDETYLVASSSSIMAKKMVDFTLSKIVHEVKSGRIPEGDIAALTGKVLGFGSDEEDDEIPESDLDEYIDETIQTCVSSMQDRNSNSPVCDALLDDFMVNTLQSLIKDLENEVLTKDQIQSLAKTVKDEAKGLVTTESELLDVQDVQNVLQKMLRELQSGAIELHVLYQIVFAIVYSYNMLKSPPTPEFESKVTTLMRELLFIVEQQAQVYHLDDVNVDLLQKASELLQKEVLDVHQIEQLSSTILEIVAKPDIVCRTSSSEIARSIVEDALTAAKAKLLGEEDHAVLSGVQNIASAIIATHDERENASPAINDLFIEVLDFLRDSIRSESDKSLEDFRELEEIVNLINANEMSSNQIEEMAKSVARVVSSPLKSESSLMAEINVKDTLKSVRADLTGGALETDILDQMIQNLLTCHRAVKAHDEMAPSVLDSLASFFKTVLGHVTYKVECGEFNADDISELTAIFQASFEKTKMQGKDRPSDILSNLSKVTDDIESGLLSSRDANRFGQKLVECGNKILTILSGVSSAISTPKSEDVAEGLVENVMKSLEEEIRNGLISKESLKEITKTIISTASETDTHIADDAVGFTIRGIHRDIERGIPLPQMPSVTSMDHSPSASTIADHFVVQTIDYINCSIKQEMPKAMIASVATSMVSLISDEKIENLPAAFQSVKKTIQAIVRCLKSGSINQADAEKIFCLVLENYRDFVLTDTRDKSLPDSLPREDQELVNTVIDETLLNIQRSVVAGKLSKKHFSIPSQTSAAGSTTVCGEELVELTLDNVKRYFSTKSVAGSSTIYAHDIVDETLKNLPPESSQAVKDKHTQRPDDKLKSDAGSSTICAHELVNLKLDNIAAGIKSDAGSTTIYAYDLVNTTLENLKGKPETAAGSKPTDIVDFILQIVDILANELTKGQISDLSMAHFFSVISGDTSDLHVLEVNAQNNLQRVRQDIAEKRNSSVYVHRILDAYLVPNQTVVEMFSDPIKAVESIMISVSSEILTKFVKATLQTILVEIREGNMSLPEKAPSTFVLRSASSIVAENVIQEVVARIKHDIEASVKKSSTGVIGKKEFDRAASTLLASPQLAGRISQDEKKISDSKHSITSMMSREVEDVILETVHNIVSNLRLEQSMYPQSRTKMVASPVSDEIQEFVLDALQTIVIDMQDKKALYELGLVKPGDKVADSVTETHDTDNTQTIQYVNEVLQCVIQDMKKEKSKDITKEEEEKGSKSAANLENMILDCLQNAVTNKHAPNTGYGLEPDQEEEIKRIVIESIRQTIKHIKANKVDEAGLKSLRLGLASVIKTEHHEKTVSPESMVEFLENEILRIEDAGIDSETLGRISTQLATLGMDMLSPEGEKAERFLSEESIMSASATSSLVSNLIQDVLTKLTQELEDDTKPAHQESDSTIKGTASGHSSNSISKRDVNYNRRISSTTVATGSSAAAVKKQNLDNKRKESASSTLTQGTGCSNISDLSGSSEIPLPDNSRKTVTAQTIQFKLSQEKDGGKMSQSATRFDSRTKSGTKKTASGTNVNTSQKRIGKSPIPKNPAKTNLELSNGSKAVAKQGVPELPLVKTSSSRKSGVQADMLQKDIKRGGVDKEGIKSTTNDNTNTKSAGITKADAKAATLTKTEIKPFQHVENLHKQLTKPKTPLPKFISKTVETIRSYSQTKKSPQKSKHPKRDKPSPLIKNTTSGPKVPDKKAVAQTTVTKIGDVKRDQKETGTTKQQLEKKVESRRSVPTSVYATKIPPKKIADATKARQSLPDQHVALRQKVCFSSNRYEPHTDKTPNQRKDCASVKKDAKTAGQTGSDTNGAEATKPKDILKDALHEIKSICGSHKSKMTVRDTAWPQETSEISSSENDLSYTSEIF